MANTSDKPCIETFGSKALNEIVQKLQTTSDARRRYEYILWLGKKLPNLPEDFRTEKVKVKGCVSQVFVLGEIIDNHLQWRGYSDALITKGLLALLIQGLSNLTPNEVMGINPSFIASAGLHGSLTPSRANGFLNILLAMQEQAKAYAINNQKFSSTS